MIKNGQNRINQPKSTEINENRQNDRNRSKPAKIDERRQKFTIISQKQTKIDENPSKSPKKGKNN